MKDVDERLGAEGGKGAGFVHQLVLADATLNGAWGEGEEGGGGGGGGEGRMILGGEDESKRESKTEEDKNFTDNSERGEDASFCRQFDQDNPREVEEALQGELRRSASRKSVLPICNALALQRSQVNLLIT